jgi:hypothetical protein
MDKLARVFVQNLNVNFLTEVLGYSRRVLVRSFTIR